MESQSKWLDGKVVRRAGQGKSLVEVDGKCYYLDHDIDVTERLAIGSSVKVIIEGKQVSRWTLPLVRGNR